MTALTNTDPNITYKDILQMGSGIGTGVTGTVVTVQDGNGSNTALGLATNMVTATAFKIGANQITLGGALTTTGVVTLGAMAITGGITTGGAFTLSGAFTTTLTVTANTTLTLPITGTLATLAGSETLTNKTLTAPVIATISNSGTITVPTGTLTLATLTGTETLTNKALSSPIISVISNSGSITIPSGTDTLVGRATTDTLTNKTLTSPIFSTISNTGTLTLPTSTDTLVGRATTDTLTNKTLTTPVINGTITGTTVIPVANGGVDQTAWTAWTPGFTGFSVNPSGVFRYKVLGKTAHVMVNITGLGTSNTTGFTITGLPVTPVTDAATKYFYGLGGDNGVTVTCLATITSNSTTITLINGINTGTAATWTASGSKGASFTLIYETA